MTSILRSAAVVISVLIAGCGATPVAAQTPASPDACKPMTSARSRDVRCVPCRRGPISTDPRLGELTARVLARRDLFDDIDRRIDTASPNADTRALLQGRNLAHALYGGDADFIADGTASRCLLDDDSAARAQATAFPCEQIPRDGLAVIVTAGQSNISNTGAPARAGGPLAQPHNRFYNFNRFDGKCYVARNPLLGTPGSWENVAVALGDELIDRKLYRNVVIAPTAIGGTYLEEWRARGGKYFEIVLSTLLGLRDARLEPTAILWHQGEFNAFAFSTRGAEDGTHLTLTAAMQEAGRLSYLRNYLEIIAGLRAADVAAPIFVAEATLCGSVPDEIIRSAQASVPNPAQGVFAGPDTDQIGLPLRYDRCHMSHAGTDLHARLWADRLADYLATRR